MKFLSEIDLSRNKIEFINELDFEWNQQLEKLDLNFNKIKSIHVSAFKNMFSLKSFKIGETKMSYFNFQFLIFFR